MAKLPRPPERMLRMAKIYIASSWKNQHAVEMLTALLRDRGHEIFSFVENNHGEQSGHVALDKSKKEIPFDEWVMSERGRASFVYDTDGATKSEMVIYISPSGADAWAEVGAAWAAGAIILGLWSKGEQCGLMRRMITWFDDYKKLLACVDEWFPAPTPEPKP